MENELKEETVTALKSGIEFLGNVKKELGQNNELKTKLIHIHYLFEGLLNKWETILNLPDTADQKTKLRNSFPIFPKKNNSHLDLIEKQEASATIRKELSKSVAFEAIEKKDEKSCKNKTNLLQRFKRRSTIEDKETSSQKVEVGPVRQRLTDRECVRVPTTVNKDLNEDGYLKMKPVSNHLMHSENKFKKIAKIKLIVNNKALGSRYCGLLDDVILLGKALDNQPPEFELKVEEYKLVNLKDQVFDLVKEEMTLSLRFATEAECSDWHGMVDQISQSAVYSYVTVDCSRPSIPQKYQKPVDYANVSKKRMSVPIQPNREIPHHYCYPKFSENPIKLDSCDYVKVDCKEDTAPSRVAITETSKASESLDTLPEMTRSSEVLTSHPPVLTRKPKTNNKLNRGRSIYT